MQVLDTLPPEFHKVTRRISQGACGVPTPKPPKPPCPPPGSDNKLLWIGALVAFLLGGGAIAYYRFYDSNEEETPTEAAEMSAAVVPKRNNFIYF